MLVRKLSLFALSLFVLSSCEVGEDESPLQPMISLRDASTQCPNGGTLILTGFDRDQNGALDDYEVSDSAVICSGTDGNSGSPGQPGLSTLIRVEKNNPEERPAGGITIYAGTDKDGNGVLDPEKVTASYPFCNGENGADQRAGGINIADVNAVTAAAGQLQVIFQTPYARQVPDLVYTRVTMA